MFAPTIFSMEEKENEKKDKKKFYCSSSVTGTI